MIATDREVLLVGADGTRHTLWCDDTEPYALRPDNGLWGLTSHSINSTRSVGQVGEQVNKVNPLARTFSLPILVSGTSETDIDFFLGNLGSILNPQLDTRIVVKRAAGTSREIVARYLSGGENLAVKHPDHNHIIVPLVFRAHYPYWRDVTHEGASVDQLFTNALVGGVNSLDIRNDGDVDVWPEIWFWGDCQNIECANLTTGQVFRIIHEVIAGQTLRIDTNPASRKVWLNEFPDYAGTVDPFSEFWPLVPGFNHLYMRGATSGAPSGRFEIKWRPEYNTC